MRFQAVAIALISCCFWLLSGIISPPAHALTQIGISDLSYQKCPPELGEGIVTTGGASADANCFLITGKAKNDSGQPVYNTDIFGRIYDANYNPIMQNRTRLGSIGDVPPGISDFQLQITVPLSQPTPLKLEQFKASGFGGRVRR